MLKLLQDEIFFELRQTLAADSQHPQPVVKGMSVSFWQNLYRWVHLAAGTPEPFTIALTGASGSGKSYIREVLVQELSEITLVSSFTQDNYYRNFEQDFPELPLSRFYDEINLDDPKHIRFDHLLADLKRLKQSYSGQVLHMPRLVYGTPTTKPSIIPGGMAVEITPFIVTEGIHAFYDPHILPFYDLKIYVDIDEEHRRERWLERNLFENRGTTDNMWNTTVESLHQHILPTRSAADLVINNNVQQERVDALIHEILSVLTLTVERHQKAA
jgi:uridine kinase